MKRHSSQSAKFGFAITILLGLYISSADVTVQGSEKEGVISLEPTVREKCLQVLREGLRSEEFWPSIHAAEGLTLAGYGDEVIAYLEPKVPHETDDQHRCGLARELVRAGAVSYANVMYEIQVSDDDYGHVHAAESLYKVGRIGDGQAMRKAMNQTKNVRLRLMAAAALAKAGNAEAFTVLRKIVQSDNAEDCQIASWILARVGDKQDIPRQHELVKSAPDALLRSYSENALATLGDKKGQAALARNLTDKDPAIRTYAAVFAGDARMTRVAPQLIKQLDDEYADARYRAAQTLLFLAQPAQKLPADIQTDVFVANERNPRYTEGSIIELNDGTLLFATTEFSGSTSDFAKARIVGKTSTDGGQTWGEQKVLQENIGGLNVMSVTLRRITGTGENSSPIGMFYLIKNSKSDLQVKLKFSNDEGQSWGKEISVTGEPGYHVMNNDRVTQLSSGRLLAPVATTPDVSKNNHFKCLCYISDDGGLSWRAGADKVDLPKRGAMEPEVIELNDGRAMMIMRNQLGTISTSYSNDGGDHWSEPSRLGDIAGPEAPATIRRIPATGNLLLVWNNTYAAGVDHGGIRTPLTAAISGDEGKSWKHVRNLESRNDQTYSYTSILFVKNRVLLSYWVQDRKTRLYSSRFRSLPLTWFYENE